MKSKRPIVDVLRRLFVSILCVSFVFQQSLILPLLASEITPDVSHGMGADITQNGNNWDIKPGFTHGSTDFGHFDKFNLTQGDIANLINSIGIEKFVALVNNQVNINGLLNTLNASGAFNNGHAIFVSPSGIVIGASGVLNVGALSLITPSQNTYNAFLSSPVEDLSNLKTDSQGDITINGKIIARNGVEVYGKNISIGNDSTTTNTAGIIAGVKNNNVILTGDEQAQNLFNSLVSNNIQNPTGLDLQNGKVVIRAQASRESDSLLSKVEKQAPLKASVNIKNATVAGGSLDIQAVATDKVDVQFKNVDSATSDAAQNLGDYFNMNTPYDDFVGARAEAEINIENSNLAANGDIILGTNAAASTEVSSTVIPTGKALVYALGNATKSNINVKNTSINTTGDLTALALSQNESSLDLQNQTKIQNKGEKANAYELMVINHTSTADTGVNFDSNSTIKADNLNVVAVNATSNDIEIENKVKYQEASAGHEAGSTAGVSLLLKNDRVNTSAVVNAKTEVTGDANVTAQSLHVSSTEVSAEGSEYKPGDTSATDKDNQEHTDEEKGILSKVQGILSAFSSDKANADDPTNTTSDPNPTLEATGVVNINKSVINTTASIGSSDFKAGGDVAVEANTVDYTINQAKSESTDGAKFAPGAAVLVNSQNNTTTANISGNVTANSVKLNATTELPASLVDLYLNILGSDIVSFNIGANSDGTLDWNFDMFGSDDGDDYSGLDLSNVDFEISGEDGGIVDYEAEANLFNNQASASGDGANAGVSGAVVYNTITNNTTAAIADNSVVTANNGNVIANAVNSVVNFNSAGQITQIFKGAASGDKVGLGGSVLINDFTNNAVASIGKGATVTAQNGEVGLYSANEASYLNVIATGASSGTFALAGSVLVNNISGNTTSSIGENAKVNAKKVNVKAGEAKFRPVADTENLNNNTIAFGDERTATDKTSVLNIGGALSKQSGSSSGGSGQTSSSGAAVGATVMVNSVDKNVQAQIGNGANITASESADINADAKYQGLNVGLAGAFAGGVSVDKSTQDAANSGSGSSENQIFGNFGGWMDKLQPLVDKIKGGASSSDKAVADASGSSVTDSLQDENVQSSLNDTNKTPDGTTDNKSTTSQGQALAGTTGNLTQTANGQTAADNFSAAAAGVVTVNSNDTNVEASVGNATITVGNSLNIEATQETKGLDIATGVAKSGNVGAGAAVNVNSKGGSTTASMNGTNVTFNNSNGALNLKADENNENIAVAVGVGAASGQGGNVKAAVGGSFNVNTIDNSVTASMENVTLTGKNTDVNVTANNYSKSYKGAGGVAYAGGKGGSTNVGAGIAGNIDIYDKSTTSEITGGNLQGVKNVNVKANDKGGVTDDIIAFSIAGSVITGGSSSFSFVGAIGVNVIGNAVSAAINNAVINSSGAVDTLAYSNINAANVAGSASISTANGAGVGIGTVVNVINNEIIAGIQNSEIQNSTSVSVTADSDELLRFLAVNFGLTTGQTTQVLANAIVNVLNSNIQSYITGGSIKSTENVAAVSDYNNTVEGVTAVAGLALGNGNAVGGNIITNVYTNETTSNVNSNIEADGNVSAAAQSYENIDIIPAAVSVSTGTLAAAANIGANVIVNKTMASVGGIISKSKGVDVIANDTTDLKSRGGTVAASGTAGVGGSIIVDVLNKDVSASVADGADITSSGKVNVNASANNYSGGRDIVSINIDDILTNVVNGSTSLEDYDALKNWQMTFDLAGGGTAGVSGSIITKVVNNNVLASIGDAQINAGSVDVLATDNVVINAIVGTITAAGTAAVGGSAFVNVVTGTTQALIANGANITTTSGGVNVKAENNETVRTLMVVGGGAGTVAVNGSANVNTVVNNTLATIEDGVTINSAGGVTVEAKEQTDVESVNVAVNGSGGASVGAIAYVNAFSNNTQATVGKKGGDKTSITAGDDINVNADSKASFGSTMMMVSGAGAAGIAGAGIVNVIDSTVRAYVVNSTLSNTSKNINVTAKSDFNKWKYKDNFYDVLMGDDSDFSNGINIDDYIPIVNILAVTGSGAASVGAVAVANTITNDVSAVVEQVEIENTNMLNVSAETVAVTYDALANLAGSGVTSVTGNALVNTILGTTEASILNTTVKNGSVGVSAKDGGYLGGIMLGVSGSGTAAVNGTVNNNYMQNTISAKIKDSEIQNAQTVAVKAENDKEVATLASGISASGGFAGSALVIANENTTTNTASIENTTIKSSGETKVEASNEFKTFDVLAAGGGSSAAVNGSAIANSAKNTSVAQIKDSEINSGALTVNSTSNNDFSANNLSATIGGVAVGLGVIVNVIESEVRAYVDNSVKNITTGRLAINAQDKINLDMNVGIVAAGVGVGGAGAANVNIINNAVRAEIASTTGVIKASSIDVDAISDMDINVFTASAAGGLYGVAGAVSVTSIGGKFDDANTNEYLTTSDNGNITDVALNRADVTVSDASKGGVQANVNANIQSTGDVTVDAYNTLNLDKHNATAAIGPAGAFSANVLVTNMKYNTSASLGGNVSGNNVSVTANNEVIADTNAYAASLGSVTVGGNVAYFTNTSTTKSEINNGTISGQNIAVNAISKDTTNVSSVGANVSGVSIDATVALAESKNTVEAAIRGAVDIDATGNLDVKADNTSALSSELASLRASAISGQVVVNKAESSAITNAIVNATGTINSNNMNVIASTGGVSAKTTVNMGGLSLASATVTSQGAIVNAQFNSGINNSGLTIENTGNTKVAAGVKTNTDESGEIRAEVLAKKAQAGLAGIGVTRLNAEVNAQTNATVNAGSLKSNNLNVFSKLNRTASAGSSSASLSAIELNSLALQSSVSGSNTITIAGNNEIKNAINVVLNDNSDVNTEMLNASITLASGSSNSSKALINTNTTINIGGNLAMNSMNVTSDVERNSFNTAESKGGGLVRVGTYELTTASNGNSVINITADAVNEDFNNSMNVTSNAVNKTETVLSNNAIALAAIAKSEASNTLNTTNKINLNGAQVKSKGDVNFYVNSENRVAMKRNAEGYGAVVVFGGEVKNNITSTADIVSQNGTNIEAENISMAANAKFATIDDKNIEYEVKIAGLDARDKTNINNNVTQTSNITINDSTFKARNKMNVDVTTESMLKQYIRSQAGGFVAKNVATSNLTITNNNNLIIGSGASLEARDLDIALDSNNNLVSDVHINADQFGGRDPGAFSYLTLNVNNNVNNSGKLLGNDVVQINFMQNSENNLIQSATLDVDAAVATGDAGGSLKFNTNNDLTVNKNALISSDKDVTIRYGNGDSDLSSNVAYTKTSYLLFGIPITVSGQSKNITETIDNSLKLDGEISAGADAKYNMLIDKDGNVVQDDGFEDKYEIFNSGVITAEEQKEENDKTIATITEQIAELEAKLQSLSDDKADNDTKISEYEAAITELENMLKALDTGTTETISMDDVQSKLESSVETAANGIVDDFDSFWNNFTEQNNSENGVSFADYIKNLGYEEDDQTTLLNAYNSVQNNIKTDTETGLTYYNDNGTQKIIGDADSANAAKTNIENSIANYESKIAALKAENTNNTNSSTSLTESLNSLKSQKEYLSNLTFEDMQIDNSYIKFDDIVAPDAKIEIIGLETDTTLNRAAGETALNKITGSGDFKIFEPSIEVNNYSGKYDLVFGSINFDTYDNVGLIIENKNYSYLANTGIPINDKVLVISGEGDAYNPGITINNFFDHNNPLEQFKESTPLDITFNGIVNFSNGFFNVWNESGDIIMNNAINTAVKDIVAVQGNVTYDAASSNLNINSGDRLIAGKDVTVNANNIKIDGYVQAGYGDRNITITDEMLTDENLIVDPNTGEKNMVNTAYLNKDNNIKVLYDKANNKLLVFHTQQEGGNVNFTGNVSGKGEVHYTDGYANVNIKNDTNNELVINTLGNDRMNGGFDNKGSFTGTVVNQGHNFASTEVTSKGKVNILGVITNGKNKKDGDGTGSLNITSENGITVNEHRNKDGNVVATIDSVGKTTLENSANSGVVVDGKLLNDGELTLKNNGADGVSITTKGDIQNSNGALTVENTKGDVTVAGKVQNTNGNTSVTNNGNKITVSGTVSTTTGNTTLTNNGAGGTEISGTIANEKGHITLTNNSGDLTVTNTGNVKNNEKNTDSAGNITVTNSETSGKLTLAGLLKNFGKGDTKISSKGANGAEISGTVSNNAGDTEITNEKSELKISGTVENKQGNTSVTNNGAGGTEISGTIANEKGNITLTNNSGDLTVTNTGSVKNNENNTASAGNITVTNAETSGKLTLAGLLKNFGKGDTKINSKGANGAEISGTVSNNAGDTEITNEKSELKISGTVENKQGNTSVTNNGAGGTEISGTIANEKGNITLINNSGDLTVTSTGNVKNNEKNTGSAGNITVTNTETSGKLTLAGLLKNFGKGDTKITSQGANGAEISGTVSNNTGNTEITNEESELKISGTVENKQGNMTVTNNGVDGLNVASTGKIDNQNGSMTVTNTNGALTVDNGAQVLNNNGIMTVTNNGNGGAEIAGIVNNKKGNTKVNNTAGKLTVTESGLIKNNNGLLEVTNSGDGILVQGDILNVLGQTNITNTNGGIIVDAIGTVINNNGNLNIKNTASGGITIAGITRTDNQNINITNSDSNIIIGDASTNNNINAVRGNVNITQTNGDILNAGVDKTLIAAGQDLNIKLTDGSIGQRADSDKPAYSIDAETRDNTKSINVNIKGKVDIEASAKDGVADSGLVNLTAKNSDLNVDKIKTDGDIVLTAADWKQPDEEHPDPNNEPYYRGYSIKNASTDNTQANLEGKNISVISSNEIGEDGKALTYKQRTDLDANAKVGFEAENDIYLDGSAYGDKTNIAHLISKRGSIDFALGSDAEISEITSNNHLHILSKSKNLTIYNLGKISGGSDDFNDLLYPHDKIKLGGEDNEVVPQTVAIEVLDALGGDDANSTLRIYNAYVRGANNGKGEFETVNGNTFQKADVTLMADNIYAHSYDAMESDIHTKNHSDGFDPKADTVYVDPLTGETSYASGFNTFGDGAKLSFDITGVSKDAVADANNGDSSTRSYIEQELMTTIEIFQNKFTIQTGTDYRAKDVTLSLNSNNTLQQDTNRGLNINKLYANDAYIDTQDLELSVRDAIINNYAEFRNGNRFGSAGVHRPQSEEYRWLTIVDNDYRRLLDHSTLQLYTQKTGSFGLYMGDLITLETQAPVVNYNPYEITNLFRNENSFYRLTYKDDKLQQYTTTPGFKDIDKATYKATKRISMRFPTEGQNIKSTVPVYDISKTGALIGNDLNLKVGDKVDVSILYEDIEIDVQVEVMRLQEDMAGVRFVNMSKATANKILYLNLRRANSMKSNLTNKW